MNDKEKGKLIGKIVEALRNEAMATNRPFDEGDMFFSLAFRTDEELMTIAKLCGVSTKT